MEAVRPEGVEEDEDDVHVVALAKGRERLDALERPIRPAELELGHDGDDEEQARPGEVEPRRVEQALEHGFGPSLPVARNRGIYRSPAYPASADAVDPST